MARFRQARQLVDENYARLAENMEENFGPHSEGYYLRDGLTDEDLATMDKIMNTPLENKMSIAGVFQKSADLAGRTANPAIKLRKAQIDPVLMSYINPRFFVGDSPGLGKTVISAASYAYYRLQAIKNGKRAGKVLVVTDSIHVLKFAKEWNTFGIKLLPISGGNLGIKRAFKDKNMDDYDGIIINWDGIKTNNFVEYWLFNKRDYAYGVFDETSKLLNPKSKVFEVTDAIVNKYEEGLERVIFLNGTSFEKEIYDYYYQFMILKPKLIPSKRFLDDRYVVKKGTEIYTRDYNSKGEMSYVKRNVGEIVDYKNQAELRDRLKYYFIARSKKDYSDDLPQHSYILHGVEMTKAQADIVSVNKHTSAINSPKTSDETKELTVKNSPKLQQILDFLQTVDSDRPIIYCYNTESQMTLKKEIQALGYRVEILNGRVSIQEKTDILDRFNNNELDMLIFNITKAMNVPTSDRILFYDIPAMPQETNQIKARIDRNNYTDRKFYDFFCYLNSPEMINLVKLAYFREHHGNEFTGQGDNVYGQLVQQLSTVYEVDAVSEIGQTFEWMYDNNKKFEDIETKVIDLLDI